MSDERNYMTVEDLQATFDASPFIAFLRMQAEAVDYQASEVRCRLPMHPALERKAGTGQFHGGPIAAFIDTVGDYAIGMLIGGGVPTMNLRVDYLKPAVGEYLTGVARVRRRGRTVAIIDVDVTDPKGSLVALGRGTYSPNRG